MFLKLRIKIKNLKGKFQESGDIVKQTVAYDWLWLSKMFVFFVILEETTAKAALKR